MNTIIAGNIDNINAEPRMPNEFIFPKCKIIFGTHGDELNCKVKIETEIKERDDSWEFDGKIYHETERYIHAEITWFDDWYDVEFSLDDENQYCGNLTLLNTNHPNEDKAMGRASGLGYDIFCICNYIMTANRDRRIAGRNQNKKNISKTSGVTIPKKVYLLDEIIEYVNENRPITGQVREREIQCPCWSVRGHYRHYKSGKVVFVKNYLKGKKRETEKPKPKEYFI